MLKKIFFIITLTVFYGMNCQGGCGKKVEEAEVMEDSENIADDTLETMDSQGDPESEEQNELQ